MANLDYHEAGTRKDREPKKTTYANVSTPETGPAPGTLEYWRWTMAAQAMQGLYANMDKEDDHTMREVVKQVSKVSVIAADALIAELKGGKP